MKNYFRGPSIKMVGKHWYGEINTAFVCMNAIRMMFVAQQLALHRSLFHWSIPRPPNTLSLLQTSVFVTTSWGHCVVKETYSYVQSSKRGATTGNIRVCVQLSQSGRLGASHLDDDKAIFWLLLPGSTVLTKKSGNMYTHTLPCSKVKCLFITCHWWHDGGRRGVGIVVWCYLCLTWMGVHGQRHTPAALPPGKRPGTHCALLQYTVLVFKRIFQNKKKLFDNIHTQMHVTLVVF